MKNLLHTSGQSLIETTVAIGVVITGLVGALSLVNFTVRSTTTTTNRLIAQNLAWEGVEVAVNLRDSDLLAGNAFDATIVGADTTAIAVFDENANSWSLDFGPNLFSEPETTLVTQGGVYRQSTAGPAGEPSVFKRLITLTPSAPGLVEVVSEVQWDERGSTKSVVAERDLWEWR